MITLDGLCSRADKDFVLTGCHPAFLGHPSCLPHQAIEGRRSGLGSGHVLHPASDTLPPPHHILHVPVCASRSFSPLHAGWVQGWHRSRSRSRLFPPSRNPVSSRREFCSPLHPQMGLLPGNQCRSPMVDGPAGLDSPGMWFPAAIRLWTFSLHAIRV